jgi:thiamine biosynthesis lipoprotein
LAAELEAPALRLEARAGGRLAACFDAMASPCELLLAGVDESEALALGRLVASEALRIERKYSRYRGDSVLADLHAHRGEQRALDPETVALLEFARHCHELSDGRFDISSGVLRRAWRFDGSDRLPAAAEVAALMPLVGFAKLGWHPPHLLVPEGMELDFGGIGKEYAVDRAFQLVAGRHDKPFLVNFGGDLRASEAPPSSPWQVGVERPGSEREPALMLTLSRGALATSGDARRFLLKDGVRYGHVLDPRTGWPVQGGPRSVTVAASSCVEAGMLATLALLQGAGARDWLDLQQARYWLVD